MIWHTASVPTRATRADSVRYLNYTAYIVRVAATCRRRVQQEWSFTMHSHLQCTVIYNSQLILMIWNELLNIWIFQQKRKKRLQWAYWRAIYNTWSMTKRAKPKSESLACPWSSRRMFSHLRSLCAMLWLCRYWTASTTPWKMERVSFSGSEPRLRMYSSRSPRFACSIMTHVYAPIRTICNDHIITHTDDLKQMRLIDLVIFRSMVQQTHKNEHTHTHLWT